MRIVIIGLGLIGGSLALALRAAPSADEIWAVDRDEATRRDALDAAVVDAAYAELADAPLADADLIFLCLHPEACAGALREMAPRLRAGTVVTDVCGIKRPIAACARAVLPSGVTFIGGHPMAGKERGGFANATPTLFHRAHYLLAPQDDTPPEATALLCDIAERIGCLDVLLTTPETHDAHIAYTSQMMHVLALAICEQRLFETSKGFEGGSFRGATRVAALDAGLWAELFWENRDQLAAMLGELEGKLGEYRDLLTNGDQTALRQRLEDTAARKEAWNHAECAGSGRAGDL